MKARLAILGVKVRVWWKSYKSENCEGEEQNREGDGEETMRI